MLCHLFGKSSISLKCNIKSFCSFINSKRKFRKIFNSVSLGGVEACKGDDVAHLFASHFKSVDSTSSPTLPPRLAVPITLQNIQITQSKLIKAINNMNTTAGPGPDQPLFITTRGASPPARYARQPPFLLYCRIKFF